MHSRNSGGHAGFANHGIWTEIHGRQQGSHGSVRESYDTQEMHYQGSGLVKPRWMISRDVSASVADHFDDAKFFQRLLCIEHIYAALLRRRHTHKKVNDGTQPLSLSR